MSDLRHQRLRALFDAALAIPPGERQAYVAGACGDDPDLGAQLAGLLAAVDEGPFLAAPERAALPTTIAPPAVEAPGTRIGPYHLLRQLGEGGFGTVWLAEQREGVLRQVALKVLKPGMDTTQVVARFEQERQVLALLDHPHVARVIDAGATTGGRPFFVMEFVDGLPLVAYCDRARLSVAARLELFVQVCDAVQHAHGRGIVHRDLKPSNVLVTERDGRPHAKVIDFGIAKAIAQKLTDHTLFTEARQVVGTLPYMSPEQAAGAADLDIRTDVWSLGVLLYEVLTGSLPFQPGDAHDVWQNELQQRIREQDPPKPSTRLQTAAHAGALAAGRNTTVARLVGEVRGELDWIVLRALAKERQRRYQTAHELAADLRRHLVGEPVLAAPPSAAYRARTFVRRNRGAVLALAAVLTTLVGGVAAFAWQAKVAGEERDRAVLAEAQSRQILDLMLEAMRGADPFEGGGSDQRVTEAMARAAAMLDGGRLAGQPAVELELRLAIANVLANQGAAAASLPHAERAVALVRQLAGPADRRTVLALYAAGQAEHQLGHLEAADQRLAEAVAVARQVAPGDHELLATMLHQHGSLLADRGRAAAAATAIEEGLAMARRLFRGDHWYLAGLLNAVGHLHWEAGRIAEALPRFREALAMAERLAPGDHPKTARYLANLAMARAASEPQAAVSMLEASLAMGERLHAGDHPDAVQRRVQLGGTLRQLGRFEAATARADEALAMARRIYAGDHARVAAALELQAEIALDRGQLTVAEALHTEALAMRRRLHPGDHPDVAKSWAALANTRLRLGRSDGVAAMLDDALAMSRRLYPGDHDRVEMALRDLGYAAWRTGRGAEATRWFAEALAMCRRLRPGDTRALVDRLDDLGSAQLQAGERAAAEAAFVEALAVGARLDPGDHVLVVRLQLKLADGRLAAGLPAEAEVAFAAAFAAVQDAREAELATLADCLRGQGLWYLQNSRPAVAARLFEQLLTLQRRRHPRGHADTVQAHDDLGLALARQARHGEAARVFAAGLDLLATLAAPSAELELRLRPKLAEMQRELGRFDDAVAGYTAAVALAERLHQGGHPVTVQVRRALGFTEYLAGRPARAEIAFAAALAMQQRLVPQAHRDTVNLLDDLGSARLQQGQHAAAAEAFAAALGMLAELPAADPAKEQRLRGELAKARGGG